MRVVYVRMSLIGNQNLFYPRYIFSLVQDCVFTRSLEFQFGVQRKDWAEPWFGVRVRFFRKDLA